MKVVVLLLACFILLIVGNGANAVTKFILFVHSNYIIGQLIIKKSLQYTFEKKNEEQCMIMLQCVYTYTVKNIKIILKLDNYTLLCSDNNEILLT